MADTLKQTRMGAVNRILLVFCACAGLVFPQGCRKSVEPSDKVTVHIGAILPMTGPAGQYGTWVQRGMEIGRIEAREQYPDVQIDVSYEDSQADPKQAVSTFHKLALAHVNVVFAVTSGDSLAIAPLSTNYGIPVITGTLVPGITDKSPLLIRNGANMATETQVMAQYLASQNPKPKVAIIYVNNDVGSFSQENFRKLYEAEGGTVTGAEAYPPGATDFRPQLTRLSQANPDVLYFLSYSEWATIEKQARELGMKCDFAGATPTEDAKALEIAGDVANGTIYTRAAFDPNDDDPVVKDFQHRYVQKYGTAAEVWAATFRDNVLLVAKAATEGAKTGAELVNTIINFKTYQGASGETEFLADRDTNKPVSIFTIIQGRFQPLGRPDHGN